MTTDTLPRVRHEAAAPEELEWRDTGCEFAPECLHCPLPQCRYDSFQLAKKLRHKERDDQIVAARAAGDTPSAIAERFGLSRRMVFRILRSRARA